MKTTSEENTELDQMAHDLCYYAIRFSGLYRELENNQWDTLAEQFNVSVRAHLDGLIDAEFTRLQSEHEAKEQLCINN